MILYRHPSLIILPMVTFFTFSRDEVEGEREREENEGKESRERGEKDCKEKDGGESTRFSFSPKFTWLNMLVNTVGWVVWGVWFYFTLSDWVCQQFLLSIPLSKWISLTLPLHLSSILLTGLFLHLDRLCAAAVIPGSSCQSIIQTWTRDSSCWTVRSWRNPRMMWRPAAVPVTEGDKTDTVEQTTNQRIL